MAGTCIESVQRELRGKLTKAEQRIEDLQKELCDHKKMVASLTGALTELSDRVTKLEK